MRKLGGCLMLIVFAVGAYFFYQQWRTTTPWGVGTGKIGGRSEDIPARDKRSPVAKTRSVIFQIAENPTRFTDKTVTVTGRVRGAGRLASNRNIYRLTDGEHRLLVIDDKAPPKDYALRTVKGKVKLLKPPIGNASYAYLVSVKEGAKIDELTWNEAKGFFTDKFQDIQKGVKEAVKEWK